MGMAFLRSGFGYTTCSLFNIMSKLKQTSLFGFLSHSTANAKRRLERGSSDESPGPTNSNEFG